MILEQILEAAYESEFDKAVDNAVSLIIKDCQPFLRSINNDVQKYRLYRGYNYKLKDKPKFERGLMLKKRINPDRTPKDTPEDISKIMDSLFEKHFGFPFRKSALFVTGSPVMAQGYGPYYLIFPIGKFDFLWDKKR